MDEQGISRKNPQASEITLELVGSQGAFGSGHGVGHVVTVPTNGGHSWRIFFRLGGPELTPIGPDPLAAGQGEVGTVA